MHMKNYNNCAKNEFTNLIKRGPYVSTIDLTYHHAHYVSGIMSVKHCHIPYKYVVVVVQINRKKKYVKFRN